MSNMWLFTPDGFFSPRYDEFCNKNEVMIRARCRDDLVKLAGVIGMEFYDIIELPKADYLYRMKIHKNDWAVYCASCAFDDRPTNVSGGLKNDKKIDNRYLTYLSIWDAMGLFQDYNDAKLKGDKKEMARIDKEILLPLAIEETKTEVFVKGGVAEFWHRHWFQKSEIYGFDPRSRYQKEN